MVKQTSKELSWVWLTMWKISENIICENIEELMKQKGRDLIVERNVEISWKIEFDAVWINSHEVFVAQIKTKLTEQDISNFVKKWLANFKKHFPKYRNYRLYWIVWWRIISRESKEYAFKKWFYVIKEYNKWRTKIVNKEDFELKEFVF